MPNHFVCVGLCARGDRDRIDCSPLTSQNLCEVVLPLPADLIEKHGAASWYEWQNKNWGTKWGTYELTVTELKTDGSPVIIKFESAWGPPNPRAMLLINNYLRDTYDLHHILWIGHDPSGGTTELIAVDCE